MFNVATHPFHTRLAIGALLVTLLASVSTTSPAFATDVSASMSYSGSPVSITADDCEDVTISIAVSGISPTTYWAAEADAQHGYASGAVDNGTGPGVTRTDLEICDDSVVGSVAKFDVSIDLTGVNDPALGSGVVQRTVTSTLTIPARIPTAVTLTRVSSSHLTGVVSGSIRAKTVKVWVRPTSSSSFRVFGTARVSANGRWHLHKVLIYGFYKATTSGAKTASTSSRISFKKPAAKPTTPSYPSGASAICNDGTYSYSAHRQGTCSWHGGVAEWL